MEFGQVEVQALLRRVAQLDHAISAQDVAAGLGRRGGVSQRLTSRRVRLQATELDERPGRGFEVAARVLENLRRIA